MELEIYKKRMYELRMENSKKVESLHIEFADSNNPHKKGDIISDLSDSILISQIGYSVVNDICTCTYKGAILRKKDKKPYASGEMITIFQSSIIK